MSDQGTGDTLLPVEGMHALPFLAVHLIAQVTSAGDLFDEPIQHVFHSITSKSPRTEQQQIAGGEQTG